MSFDLLTHLSVAVSSCSDEPQRLFHGRGQCFPGLGHMVIDWYAPAVLITLFAEHDEKELHSISEHLVSILGDRCTAVVVQKRYERNSVVFYGELPEKHVVVENGLNYSVDLRGRQNTGLFLDMANGRRWVNENSKGSNVLNLFSYSCSFSVAALAGGATKCVNVDMSKGALSTGRTNHRLNDLANTEFMAVDIMKSWGRIRRKGPYNLIIIDPPSYQKGSFVATKDYVKVLRRLPQLASENADILCCLNAPELDSAFVIDQMAEHCQAASFIQRIDNPSAFSDDNAERALKVLLFSLR